VLAGFKAGLAPVVAPAGVTFLVAGVADFAAIFPATCLVAAGGLVLVAISASFIDRREQHSLRAWRRP